MVLKVDGRSPNGHYCIPFVFVYHPIVLEDNICHCGQVFVEKHYKFLWCKLLSDTGKTFNIREENGHHSFLTTQFKHGRILDKFIYQLGRDIMLEDTFYHPLRFLLSDVVIYGKCRICSQKRQQRIDHIEPHPEIDKKPASQEDIQNEQWRGEQKPFPCAHPRQGDADQGSQGDDSEQVVNL